MNSAWLVCMRQVFKEGFLEEERANMKLKTRYQPGDRDHRWCATAWSQAIIDAL